MKKMFFLLAVTLTAGSMVWAQWTPPGPLDFSTKTRPNVFSFGFNAVGVGSIEDTLARGGFDTMTDNYIHPAFFDPQIGTFLLLGGKHNYIKGSDGGFNLGMGKTVGSLYFAGFYSGSIFVQGNNTKGVTVSNPNDNDKVYQYSTAQWNNNIAVLFGIAGMGFRFDLTSENLTDEKETYDGKYTNLTAISRTSGPQVALTWGTHFGDLYPWAKIGIKFPDIETKGGVNFSDPNLGGDNSGKKATHTSNTVLNIEASAIYDFSGGNFTDTVMGTLTFGAKFKNSFKGDSAILDSSVWNTYSQMFYDREGVTPTTGLEYDYGDAWGLKLYLHYRKAFELGKLTVKITPNLNMDVVNESMDVSGGKKNPKPTWFTLNPGVTLGLKYQAFTKFAFFTGIDLSLLEWSTYATPGGDIKDDTTYWQIMGTEWRKGTDFIRLGMAWTPIQGLVVSTEITNVLTAFIDFDVQNAQVIPGSIFTDSGAGNVGDWAMATLGKIFNVFSITVTYTF